MNKTIFNNLIRNPPVDVKNQYIFVNDNKSICEAIITVGFMSVYISQKDSENFFSAESLSEYIRDKSNTGTSILEYVFVLSCFRKKTNDVIEFAMKANQIDYKIGAWTLFKDKEYLGNYEKQGELEKVLTDYVRRFEGPDEPGMVDKEQFIKRDSDGKERGILEKVLVDYIADSVNMFVVNATPYIYRGGVYVEDIAGIETKSIIQLLLYDRHINYRTINAVYRLLIEQKQLQRRFEDLNAYPSHWINFRNGMFDVKVKKMYKHHPKYLAINQVPHKLNLDLLGKEFDTVGPVADKFIRYAVPSEEDRIMLFQYIGYCMTKDTCFQKFLIIKGVGGTGKSSVISTIQYIIGDDNVSSISLQDLTQRFYPAQLRGKLLNACADIPADALTSVDTIKKATGEDMLMYERKSVDATTFRSYAKLLFSANQIPLNLDEKSDALYRRMMILVMDKKPEKIDLELDEKLQREADYFIWQGIAALEKLYKDGYFTESSGSRQEVEKLHRAADTVKAFIDECTERQQGTDIKRSLLYEKYCEYCKGYGRKPHGCSAFYRSLEDKGYMQHRTSKDRYFIDITFKDEGFMELDVDDIPPL